MSIATVCIVVLLFYWVPFAVGAYFTDVYPYRARQSPRDREDRERHVGLNRPATAH